MGVALVDSFERDVVSDDDTRAMQDTEYTLVTQYFHPDTAATGTLMTDLATGLQHRSFEMTVLTAQPTYHSGDGARQPRRTDHEGVSVRRTGAPLLRETSRGRRLVNWLVFTVWVSLALLVSRPDRPRHVVFVSNPPVLPLALSAVCRLRGWEYTYIVHDLYPDFLVESGFLAASHPVAVVWRALNRPTYGNATAVVALGPVMRHRIVRTTGVAPDRVHVIHNWADGTFIRPLAKTDNPFSHEHGLTETLTLVYSGNIGDNHDLETVVRAAAALDEEPVRFLVIGEGTKREDIQRLAEDLGLTDERVTFLPYQPREQLPYSLTCGDVSIVAVERNLAGVSVSSKLYTSLATGMPILAVADAEDDVGHLVEEHGVGVRLSQGDVSAVADAVRAWLADPDLVERQGRRARDVFDRYYTRDAAVDEYARVLAGTATADEDAAPTARLSDDVEPVAPKTPNSPGSSVNPARTGLNSESN
jgi:glycosyltransferase involved in cell wall biosynthesis